MITPKSRYILVVDDERAVSQLLSVMLTAEGNEVAVAPDGVVAMDRIAERRPDLVILDLDMPRLGGLAVCRQLKADPKTQFLPILVLSGSLAADARMMAWEMGADEFLSKPFQKLEVAARCRSLFRHKDLIDELDSAESVLFALARTLEAKSPHTRGHSDRVTQYASDLGAAVGLQPLELDVLRRSAMLHDIGKLAIPDAILDKTGRLTPEEYEIVKRHPLDGVRIVEPLSSTRDLLPLIRWHHERLDGQGYPEGLAECELPQMVRILSVADVYDALASDRPYRPAMSLLKCRETMELNASHGGLDPELVSVFFADSHSRQRRKVES
ncbi:response regulator [soil metagenome]